MTLCMMEAVHIPEEKYNGNTIVVSQPISQQQGSATLVSQTSKDIQQLLSPSTTPNPHGTSSLDGCNQSSSPDQVEQQISQELSALRTTPHTTPGCWNFDKNLGKNLDIIRVATPMHELYIPN
jgi:hypothetical protein